MRSRYHHRKVRNDKGRNVGEWWVVIHYRKPPLYRWLERIRGSGDNYTSLRKLRSPIALLRFITINWHYRGRGYGSLALEQCMEYCWSQGCKHVILEADIDRKQKEGFDLENWYEKQGFSRIGTCWGGIHAIMVRSKTAQLSPI